MIILYILIGILFLCVWGLYEAIKKIQYDLFRIGNTFNQIEDRLLALEYPVEEKVNEPKKKRVQ